MKICIPSKARPDNMRTLKILNNVPENDIYIFVEPQDFENYKNKFQNLEGYNLINIGENDRGISFVRNFMINFMKDKDRYIWMLDDDIINIFVRGELNKEKNYYELRKIEENNVFTEGLEIAKKNNYCQLAISFKTSNWCCNEKIKEAGRAWAFVLFDLEQIHKNNISYDPACDGYEDYDITAQILKKGLMNAIYYEYAFDCIPMAKNPGGMKNYYDTTRQERFKEICLLLQKKYNPKNVNIFFNETHKKYEPQFRWKELTKYKNHSWW